MRAVATRSPDLQVGEVHARSTARREGYREGLADGRTYERRDRGVDLPSRPTGEWGTGAGEPPEEGP